MTYRKLAMGLAVAAALTVPAIAQAQEEIVVEGRYGRVPDSVKTLSQAVSYADLDLSQPADREQLRLRLRFTARYLCNKLGDSPSPVAPGSCREEAVRSAMARVGTVEEGFAPRGSAWVRPKRWTAPYPDDYTTRYPEDATVTYP